MKVRILMIVFFLIFSCNTFILAQDRNADVMATLGKLSGEFERIAEVVSPAVVRIIATGYTASSNDGTGLLSKQRSSGSGVILDPDGYIITNGHVVDGAKRIQVELARTSEQQRRSILKPRGQVVGAQIVGIDRETDLAVLKVGEKNLNFLKLGNSDAVRKGQIVLAFGSPLGLENSVTMGVVSSVARQLQSEDPMIYIQTDAPINPGNSGGPLVSTRGEVVGINTLIFSQSGGSEGIGFAAPSNIVKNVYTQIKETGRVLRGEIGIYAQTVTPLLAAGLGLSENANVIVADVKPYSPAANAGLAHGDVLLKLDGKVMENARQFDINLYGRAVGESVLVEVKRGTVIKTVKVAITERPDDPARFAELVTPQNNLIPQLNILGLDIDETIAKMLPALRIKSGVVIANQPNLAYESEEFLPGDVIHAVNNQPVESLSQLRKFVDALKIYSPVVVMVERRAGFRYVAFELE